MPSNAKSLFDKHIQECREAIVLYNHLGKYSAYKPDFSLRFSWIATISAFDHYISQIIIERATELYANGEQLMPKLLADDVSFSNALLLRSANPIDSILIFKEILGRCIKYKSFQNAEKVADGLSYIWNEKRKWKYISEKMGQTPEIVKEKLGNIVDRRNLIAHNADYDEARRIKMPINQEDATEALEFIDSIVTIIDNTIYP